ncbi:UNVERIFIED_CONTAM: hypothetical protein FKN15_030709 [Acipenser sinensis]
MFLKEIFCILVTSLYNVPAVQGGDWGVNYPPQKMCALKGSSVVIPCTYDYPERFEGTGLTVVTLKWFRSSIPGIADRDTYVYRNTRINVSPEYKHRTEYLGNKVKNCTLQIRDLQSNDADRYYFRFETNQQDGKWTGVPGVSLSITDSPKNTSASVRAPGGIAEESSVTLSCTSNANPPVSSYTWFRRDGNGDEEKAHQQHLNFSSITSSDSGDYYCEANNSLGAQNSSSVHLSVTGRRNKPSIEESFNNAESQDRTDDISNVVGDSNLDRNEPILQGPAGEDDILYTAIHFQPRSPER